MLFFSRRNFRYNSCTFLCKIFTHQIVLVKNMRYDEDVLNDLDVYNHDDKRIWIASDQIVLWIHSQWYNALKHLQNKMVDMIKMDVMLSTFPSEFFLATKLFLSSTKSIVFLLANIVLTSGGNCHEDPAVARSVIGEKTGRAVRNETRSGISCSLCLWNPGKDSSWIFEEKSSQRESFPSIERDLLVESESETAGEERVNIGEDPQGTQGQCERNPAGVTK